MKTHFSRWVFFALAFYVDDKFLLKFRYKQVNFFCPAESSR